MRARVMCLSLLFSTGCFGLTGEHAPRISVAGQVPSPTSPRVPATPTSFAPNAKLTGPATAPAATTEPDALKTETTTASRPPPSRLAQAAACMAKGNDGEAQAHLAAFLQTEPRHANARYYHAELLVRLKKPGEALSEFEKAIELAQENDDSNHLIHCHGRASMIGDRIGDEYVAHLHRGIGLFLLARNAREDDEPHPEGLYFKAAADLIEAHRLRPTEARPCWYLSQVWRGLAQQSLATRWLHRANKAAPFTKLTSTEQWELQLLASDAAQRHRISWK